MEPAGWIFMLGSIFCVLSLISFCFYRVLTHPGYEEHLHAPLDIDTKDKE